MWSHSLFRNHSSYTAFTSYKPRTLLKNAIINIRCDLHYHKLINRVEESLSLIENPVTNQKPQVTTVKKSFSQFLPTLNASCSSLQNVCKDTSAVHEQVFHFGASNKTRRIVKPLKTNSCLSNLAVSIMNSWYERNKDFPYPSAETSQSMATSGNITTSQVRKWFANKRSRNNNTRTTQQIFERRQSRKRPMNVVTSPSDKRQRVE